MEDYIIGSGNVFQDLGFSNASERLTKAKLAAIINQIIEERGLRPEEVKKILSLRQAQFYALSKGRLNSFSISRLFSFLEALDQHVSICLGMPCPPS